MRKLNVMLTSFAAFAGGGNSYLDAGEGNNTLIATDGYNTLIAGSGNGSLSAGGNNYLDGEARIAAGGRNNLRRVQLLAQHLAQGAHRDRRISRQQRRAQGFVNQGLVTFPQRLRVA